MSKKDKILVSMYVLFVSIGAACCGLMLAGEATIAVSTKLICEFFFIMQIPATSLAVISLFRKEAKNDFMDDKKIER